MKLQQLSTGQYFLTLPRQLVRAKQWSKGDNIKIEIDRAGNLVLMRATPTD